MQQPKWIDELGVFHEWAVDPIDALEPEEAARLRAVLDSMVADAFPADRAVRSMFLYEAARVILAEIAARGGDVGAVAREMGGEWLAAQPDSGMVQ